MRRQPCVNSGPRETAAAGAYTLLYVERYGDDQGVGGAARGGGSGDLSRAGESNVTKDHIGVESINGAAARGTEQGGQRIGAVLQRQTLAGGDDSSRAGKKKVRTNSIGAESFNEEAAQGIEEGDQRNGAALLRRSLANDTKRARIRLRSGLQGHEEVCEDISLRGGGGGVGRSAVDSSGLPEDESGRKGAAAGAAGVTVDRGREADVQRERPAPPRVRLRWKQPPPLGFSRTSWPEREGQP